VPYSVTGQTHHTKRIQSRNRW